MAAARKRTGGAAKRPGRKHGLTSTVAAAIVEAVEAGAFQKDAAAAAGVSETTLYRWLQEGAKDGAHPELREFRESLTRARAHAKVSAIATLRRAASDDWRAAAFLLERAWPDEWGRRTRLEHTGRDGGPVEVASGGVDLSKLSDQELEELQGMMQRAAADS